MTPLPSAGAAAAYRQVANVASHPHVVTDASLSVPEKNVSSTLRSARIIGVPKQVYVNFKWPQAGAWTITYVSVLITAHSTVVPATGAAKKD